MNIIERRKRSLNCAQAKLDSAAQANNNYELENGGFLADYMIDIYDEALVVVQRKEKALMSSQ